MKCFYLTLRRLEFWIDGSEIEGVKLLKSRLMESKKNGLRNLIGSAIACVMCLVEIQLAMVVMGFILNILSR